MQANIAVKPVVWPTELFRGADNGMGDMRMRLGFASAKPCLGRGSDRMDDFSSSWEAFRTALRTLLPECVPARFDKLATSL